MADNIDNLLVGLSLQTDAQSFRKGEAALMGLRNAGLTAGAAVTAAAGGVAALSAMAKTRAQLEFTAEAMGISADEADRLGFAISQLGGDYDSAAGSLNSMLELQDRLAALGESGLIEAGKLGIQPQAIAEASSELEGLLELSRQLQGLSEERRNIAIRELGFQGTGVANLLRRGPDEFRSLLDRADELRGDREEAARVGQETTQALGELTRAVDSLNDSLVVKFAPALTGLIERWTDFITGEDSDFDAEAYRRGLTDHPGMPAEALDGPSAGESARRWFEGRDTPMTRSQGSVADDEEFRAAVARANREIGAPEGLLWAQMGQESSYNPRAVSPAGARGLAQIMPETERSLEERFGRDLDPFDPMDALKMQQELMRENFQNSGSWTEALRLYHGGYDRSQWGPVNEAYAPAIEGRMQNPQANMSATFNIYDARDPEMVAKVVRREVRDLSERGANSYRSRVT